MRRNLGSILTVGKGRDKADDVKLTHESKLVLVPEPTNKYDSNAVRIGLATDADKYCGYLPRKLVFHIAKYLSNKKIEVECLLLPPSPSGLAEKYSVWAAFNVQLNFYATTAAAEDESIKVLESLIDLINADVSNRI